MKRLVLILGVLGVLAAAPSLAAKGDGWIGLQIGSSIPVGDLHDSIQPGPTGAVSWTFMESSHRGIEGAVAYHGWNASYRPSSRVSPFIGRGLATQLEGIQFTGSGVYDVRSSGKVRPYAKAGCGVYWIENARLGSGGWYRGEWRPYFGYVMGTGTRIHFGPRSGVDLGASYHWIFEDGPKHDDVLTVAVSLVQKVGGR